MFAFKAFYFLHDQYYLNIHFFHPSYTHIQHSWILLLQFELMTTSINPLTHLSYLIVLDGDDNDDDKPIFEPRD